MMPMIQKGDSTHFHDQPATGRTPNSLSKMITNGIKLVNLTLTGM
ncbi:MAG TPA: hypothetical protein VM187_02915 [Niastella sp.]|nr:hypothetical protein [Niastella sp.]